jgi:hypothetical protein
MIELELVYSPKWFYGRDIFIDIISTLVLILIIFFTTKAYFLTKKKNYFFFSASFFLIFLSLLGKILMNFTIYNEIVDTRHYGFATLTYEKIISSDNLYFAGFLCYRVFTLFGLYLLYSIYHKQSLGNTIFVFLLIILSMYYSHSSSFIFYFLTFILLVLISIQYFKKYKENRHSNTKLLIYSFSIIAISQLISIFIKTNLLFYVIAEVIQLIGYIILLFTFFRVLKYGKKEIKA